MPEIKFINSPKTERDRLEFTKRVVGSGFYQEHGFIVVPSLIETINPCVQVVYQSTSDYMSVDVSSYYCDWEKVGTKLWLELERYFPGVSAWWKSIEVRVGRWGTVATSGKLATMRGEEAVFYLRNDAELSHLAAIMINTILHDERKSLGVTWTKREMLMDFIMTRPVMKQLFPGFKPVSAQLSRVPMKWRKYSENYVRGLGIPLLVPDWEFRQGKVWFKGKALGKKFFTKKEGIVIEILVQHKDELVTYDELADVMWGEGEFKTFWALNKMVERLRQKLVEAGIAGERLLSIRGQGYLLK